MNVLAIGAHFDDMELGCSGTLIKHVNKGDRVTMLTLSNSEYKNAEGKRVRNAAEAFEEGKQAADRIGADLICFNYNTFSIPFDESLTKLITYQIEKLHIDTIYSHWSHDVHRDHQYSARCALMAGRHVPRFLMYRSNFYLSDESFRGNFFSDISDVMDKKIEAIKAHKSELERVQYKWLSFIQQQNNNDGAIIGVEYAECFEIIRYLI